VNFSPPNSVVLQETVGRLAERCQSCRKEVYPCRAIERTTILAKEVF
jgi:hypothetical protein